MPHRRLFECVHRYTSAVFPAAAPMKIVIHLSDGQKIALPIPPCVHPHKDTAHAADFSCVTWRGEEFTFAPTQAAIVRQLWEAKERGEPGLRNETLLEGAGSESRRVLDVFKHHPAWGVMITCSAGVCRLAD